MARVVGAWRAMAAEQRLASVASLLLLATLFLPWYQKSYFDPRTRLPVQDSLSGFGSADFVLASAVLVALALLGMMFARAEGRGFHLPGGDGLVVMVAGGWIALLIFYRVLDHPDASGTGATVGIQWGVFVAFLAAAFLIYAGFRIRSAHRPEPPLPAAGGPRSSPPPSRPARPPRRRPATPDAGGEGWRAVDVPAQPRPASEEPTEIVPRRRRPRPPEEPPPPGQLSFDEPETRRLPER